MNNDYVEEQVKKWFYVYPTVSFKEHSEELRNILNDALQEGRRQALEEAEKGIKESLEESVIMARLDPAQHSIVREGIMILLTALQK